MIEVNKSCKVPRICRGNSLKIVWSIKVVDYNGTEIESNIPDNVVVKLLQPDGKKVTLTTINVYQKSIIVSFAQTDITSLGVYSMECSFTVDGVTCRYTKANAFEIVETTEDSLIPEVDGMKFITNTCQIGTTENILSFTVLDVNEDSGDSAEELYTKIAAGSLFKAKMDGHIYMADIATTDAGYTISFYTGTYMWSIAITKNGSTYTKTYSYVKYDN